MYRFSDSTYKDTLASSLIGCDSIVHYILEVDSCFSDTNPQFLQTVSRNNWQIFPNPNNGAFSVDLGIEYLLVDMEIVDLSGRIVDELKGLQSRKTYFLNVPSGVYVARLKSGKQQTVTKMVITRP